MKLIPNTRLTVKLPCMLVALLCLGACSYIPRVPVPGLDRVVGDDGIFRDRKEEYLEARSIPRTEIPADMDSYIIDDLLVIPELPQNSFTAFPDAPRPMPMERRSSREVVIQRMEQNSWIIAEVSPGQVWPRIRDYWRQRGVPIEVELPSDGLMETGWFILDGNVVSREKFRISVENGFQDNSSEIRIRHVSAPQATPVMQVMNWPESSADPELTYDYTLDLSQYLADVSDLYQASSVSLQARNLSAEGKASLQVTPAGNTLLRLRADYDRSFAALRRALLRGGIEIVRDSASLGVIDLAFNPELLVEQDEEEDEGPGFFKRLITLNGVFSDDQTEQSFRIRLQLLKTGELIEVLAVPFEDQRTSENMDALTTLMQFLRNTIA